MGGTTLEQDLRGRVEEDDGNPRFADEFKIARLDEGASSKGKDQALVWRRVVLKRFPQALCLNLAEVWFSGIAKDVRDGTSFPLADTVIEVDEVPAELFGEESADGRFAGSHESNENDSAPHSESVNIRRERTKCALCP